MLEEAAATGAASYPLGDALGSARARTDGSGAVVATADWDPWGNLRASSGGQGGLGWTGELTDDTTGLVYLRARDYSPGTGRFTTRDTVSPNGPATQGYSAYAYTANNPITRTDPSGHDPEFVASLGLLGGLIDAFLNVRTILANLDSIPAMLRGLVKAIAGFAIGILRSLIGIVMFQVAVTGVPLIAKTMTGRSISLIQFSRLFTPVKKFIDACAGRFSLCKLIPKAFPKLPCVVGVLATSATIAGAYAGGTLTWTSGGQYTVEAFEAASDCKNWTPDKPKDGPGDSPDFPCSNSFPGETGVLLADGTTKPIADVEVGELVLALDPRTGERGPREVEAVIEGAGEKRLIALTLATGDGVATLRATAQHPFWLATEGRWAYAEDLTSGDLLLTAEGTWVRVLRADETQVPATTVYNLTVDGLHTYFVTGAAHSSADADDALRIHNRGVRPRFKGQRGVAAVEQSILASGGSVLGRQPTVEVVVNGKGGPHAARSAGHGQGRRDFWVEVKNGQHASMGSEQTEKYEALATSGGIVRGDRLEDAGFPAGSRLDPIRYETRSVNVS